MTVEPGSSSEWVNEWVSMDVLKCVRMWVTVILTVCACQWVIVWVWEWLFAYMGWFYCVCVCGCCDSEKGLQYLWVWVVKVCECMDGWQNVWGWHCVLVWQPVLLAEWGGWKSGDSMTVIVCMWSDSVMCVDDSMSGFGCNWVCGSWQYVGCRYECVGRWNCRYDCVRGMGVTVSMTECRVWLYVLIWSDCEFVCGDNVCTWVWLWVCVGVCVCVWDVCARDRREQSSILVTRTGGPQSRALLANFWSSESGLYQVYPQNSSEGPSNSSLFS